ncbi:hypothetical protein B0T25DRAFT_614217 [Lasiosphaeria hispida]|uniref:Uncharacterized protein n=1 Tax=Lasiosphaeria hispida TaxID=260671 RepID=A0AAJ0HCU0_9PEZI|nr:hypothetical protein B0T25DRAFT_614217 [Lasiosphaeria hispida]
MNIYIKNNDPYGAAQLLCRTEPGSDPGSDAPGFEVSFVNDTYFEDPPNLPNPTTDEMIRWDQWLTNFCSLTEAVSIYDAEHADLAPAGNYVAEHRPEKFLGLLRKEWARTLRSQAIRDPRSSRPLSTYLPLPDLVAFCDRFMIDGEFFPWLKLETSLSKVAADVEWSALSSAFGLGYDRPMLDLALVVLKHIFEADMKSEEALAKPERMHQRYTYLQSMVSESSGPEECRKIIRPGFKGREYVYVPTISIEEGGFVDSILCIWSAPTTLTCVDVLQTCYHEAFSLTPDQVMSLETFFVYTLNIPAMCGWDVLIGEITWQQDTGEMTHDRATELYKCLMDMDLTGDDAEKLRQSFLSKALIFRERKRRSCLAQLCRLFVVERHCDQW